MAEPVYHMTLKLQFHVAGTPAWQVGDLAEMC